MKQDKCPSNKKKERVQAKKRSLREGSGRRLKKLTVKDIPKPGKAAALDAKAAEVRHLRTDRLELLANSRRGTCVRKLCTMWPSTRHVQALGDFQQQPLCQQWSEIDKPVHGVGAGSFASRFRRQRYMERQAKVPISWGIFLMNPESATAPKTAGLTGMKPKAFSFRSFFAREEDSPNLVTGRESATEVGSRRKILLIEASHNLRKAKHGKLVAGVARLRSLSKTSYGYKPAQGLRSSTGPCKAEEKHKIVKG